MYRYLRPGESKLKFWAKGIVAMIATIPLVAYSAFHAIVWMATYMPGVPLATKELKVVEVNHGRRGRAFVVAHGREYNPVYMRLSGISTDFREGDVVTVHCRDIGIICRITDPPKVN